MTFLQLLRLWGRRAPVGERVGALAAAALGLTAISWLLVPASAQVSTSGFGGTGGQTAVASSGGLRASATAGGATSSAYAGGSNGGGGGAGASTPSAAGAGSPGNAVASATTGANGSPTAGPNCSAPPGSDQGVSSSGITVAVLILNLAGAVGNQTYNVPSPAQQQAEWQALIDSVNAAGGVACRKIVPQYYQGNAVDSSQLQQLCLTIVQARPFFVFENSVFATVYPSLLTCFVQNQLPFLSSYAATAQQTSQWYPYAFFHAQFDQDYRDMIFGLAQRGWFSAAQGFKKLGVAYQDCDSQIPPEFFGWLHQAGLTSSQVMSYDLGCNGLFSPPSVMEQAILQFKTQGVTNVTFAYDERDYGPWTQIAEQQHFNPKYAFSDVGPLMSVTYSNNGPSYDNIANAVMITNFAGGEEHTPGMQPSAITDQCLAIFGTKITYPVSSVSEMMTEGLQGGYCDTVWQFRAMVDHAPALQRGQLVAGLQAAKSIDLAYPDSPVDWSSPHTTWSGQYWRVNQFFTSCDCWRLIDATYHGPL